MSNHFNYIDQTDLFSHLNETWEPHPYVAPDGVTLITLNQQFDPTFFETIHEDVDAMLREYGFEPDGNVDTVDDFPNRSSYNITQVQENETQQEYIFERQCGAPSDVHSTSMHPVVLEASGSTDMKDSEQSIYDEIVELRRESESEIYQLMSSNHALEQAVPSRFDVALQSTSRYGRRVYMHAHKVGS